MYLHWKSTTFLPCGMPSSWFLILSPILSLSIGLYDFGLLNFGIGSFQPISILSVVIIKYVICTHFDRDVENVWTCMLIIRFRKICWSDFLHICHSPKVKHKICCFVYICMNDLLNHLIHMCFIFSTLSQNLTQDHII